MPNTVPCPCCGAPVAAVQANGLKAVPMPASERTIVSVLVGAYPELVQTSLLIREVWANDPAGGPLDAQNNISVKVHRINQRIKPYGWRIRGNGAWHGRRLEQVSAGIGEGAQ